MNFFQEADLESLREKIDAENEAKAEIQKAMSRAAAEAQMWKSKFGTEAVARYVGRRKKRREKKLHFKMCPAGLTILKAPGRNSWYVTSSIDTPHFKESCLPVAIFLVLQKYIRSKGRKVIGEVLLS